MVNSNLKVNISGENFEFSSIFDSMPRILTLISPDAIILNVNKMGRQLSAMYPAKLIGYSIWDLPLWDHNVELKAEAQQMVKNVVNKPNFKPKPLEIYFPVIKKNIRITIYPVKDEHENVKYIVIEGETTDKLSQIERELILSEEKYRSLYNTDNDAIMIVDINRGFLSGNPATIKMFGCKDEAEFISKSPADLSPEYQPDKSLSAVKAKKMMQIAIDTGAHYFNWTHKRLDGTLFFATVLLNRMVLQGKVLLHARVRDISEQIQSEKQQQRLLAIIELSNNLIAITDMNNSILYLNSSGRKLLGWSDIDISQMNVDDALPPWATKKKDEIAIPFAISNGTWSGEMALIDVQGNEIPVIQQTICHKNSMGEPEYFSTIMVNISDRKRVEEEQNRRQMIEAIALLAGGIAHDFNNLLTSILGNLSLLKIDEHQSPNTLDIISDAEKATLIATELAKQLLTFSRTRKLVKAQQNLAEIIQDTANFAIRGTDITAKFDFEQDLWAVNGDKDQLSQIFLNLVLNGIQAKPKDGIVRISAENLPLLEGNSMGLKPGMYVLVMVRDRGEGIPPEQIKNIFNPYFTTKSSGVGLGLTITHAIVNQHGGKIMVESQIGKGTIFSIYLPALAEKFTAEKVVSKKLPVEKLRGLKLLVLEDEPLIVSLIHNFSKKLEIELNYSPDGHEIINSYREALDLNTPFDVVILDLTIRGGIGGEATIKELLQIDPHITAIASSGYSKKPVMEEYDKFGFKSVLKKPYTFEEFVTTLLELMK